MGPVGSTAFAHTWFSLCCPRGHVGLTPACSVAVVERVDSCASLYSRSIQGHHICLLVKKVSRMKAAFPPLATTPLTPPCLLPAVLADSPMQHVAEIRL